MVHASALLAVPGHREDARHLLQTEYEKRKSTSGSGVHIGLMLGRMLADDGSYSEAIAVYEEIRKDFPRAAAYELAQLHTRLGQDREARAARRRGGPRRRRGDAPASHSREIAHRIREDRPGRCAVGGRAGPGSRRYS